MRATLQKLAANSGDKMDSVQFRVDEAEVQKSAEQLLGMRRFDLVMVRFQAHQAQLTDDGKSVFADVEFQALATSLSLCVTETGIIGTLTFSHEDPFLFREVIQHNLRNQVVELTFKPGVNPDKV